MENQKTTEDLKRYRPTEEYKIDILGRIGATINLILSIVFMLGILLIYFTKWDDLTSGIQTFYVIEFVWSLLTLTYNSIFIDYTSNKFFAGFFGLGTSLIGGILIFLSKTYEYYRDPNDDSDYIMMRKNKRK